MRRSPGGLLLLVSGVLLALAVGSWWLQRVAFSPTSDSAVALSVLGDEEIRGEVATVIASADAPTLQMAPSQLKEDIEEIARIPAGAALMSDIVFGAHARLIGDLDDPVLITAEEQITIVRDERVWQMATITLPVQEVGTYSRVYSIASWTTLIGLALGVITLIAGLVLRPERGEKSYALSVAMGAVAGFLVVLGYLVPLLVLPLLSDSTWAGIFSRLANHHRNLTLGLAAGALVVAVLIAIFTGGRGQRRQGSTPLAAGRYRETRNWGG